MQVLGFFFCKRTNTSVTVRERTATGSTDVEYQASILGKGGGRGCTCSRQALPGGGEQAGACVADKHYLGKGKGQGDGGVGSGYAHVAGVFQTSITWGGQVVVG